MATCGGNDQSALNIDFDCLLENQGIDTKLSSIGGILSKITPILFTFAGIILFLMLIFGGFSYLTSSGDPKKIEAAKGRITGALIGFIIVITAFWIVQIFAYIFNLPELSIFLGGTSSN